MGSLWSANTAAGSWQTAGPMSKAGDILNMMGVIPLLSALLEMTGLLNTSSCAPANLEAGDLEEIAQVDALLLMSDLQCVGELGAPVHC